MTKKDYKITIIKKSSNQVNLENQGSDIFKELGYEIKL